MTFLLFFRLNFSFIYSCLTSSSSLFFFFVHTSTRLLSLSVTNRQADRQTVFLFIVMGTELSSMTIQSITQHHRKLICRHRPLQLSGHNIDLISGRCVNFLFRQERNEPPPTLASTRNRTGRCCVCERER